MNILCNNFIVTRGKIALTQLINNNTDVHIMDTVGQGVSDLRKMQYVYISPPIF